MLLARSALLSAPEAATGQSQVGLYDQAGMLRFAGDVEADCLAYAALFGLHEGSYSLVPLGSAGLLPLR